LCFSVLLTISRVGNCDPTTTDAQIGTVTQYAHGFLGNQYTAGGFISVDANGRIWVSDDPELAPWDCYLTTTIRDAAGTLTPAGYAIDDDLMEADTFGSYHILASTTTAASPDPDNWYHYAEIDLKTIPYMGTGNTASSYQLVEWFKVEMR
jgi:hypothetical protein